MAESFYALPPATPIAFVGAGREPLSRTRVLASAWQLPLRRDLGGQFCLSSFSNNFIQAWVLFAPEAVTHPQCSQIVSAISFRLNPLQPLTTALMCSTSPSRIRRPLCTPLTEFPFPIARPPLFFPYRPRYLRKGRQRCLLLFCEKIFLHPYVTCNESQT